jgi:hypothetical protein
MNLINLLLFKGSRKVSFAIWLFITANAYLWIKLISADQWMNCVLLVTALCGGGTIADRWLENKKPPTTNGQ